MLVYEGGKKRWSLLTPENICCRDRLASHVHIKPCKWRKAGKGWKISQDLPDVEMRHSTEFVPVDVGTIELVFSLTNAGKTDMLETHANFCFACGWGPWSTGAEAIKQSWVDAAFHGPRKEKNTDWTQRSLVPLTTGLTPVNDINLSFPVAFNRRSAGGNVADFGCIVCQSIDRRETYGAGFERAYSLSCAVNSCVHVDAWLGIVPAGETRKVRGRFYYMKADPYQIIARFQRDFNIA
jgi:hypothetical protein